jgi:hypothetical protein
VVLVREIPQPLSSPYAALHYSITAVLTPARSIIEVKEDHASTMKNSRSAWGGSDDKYRLYGLESNLKDAVNSVNTPEKKTFKRTKLARSTMGQAPATISARRVSSGNMQQSSGPFVIPMKKDQLPVSARKGISHPTSKSMNGPMQSQRQKPDVKIEPQFPPMIFSNGNRRKQHAHPRLHISKKRVEPHQRTYGDSSKVSKHFTNSSRPSSATVSWYRKGLGKQQDRSVTRDAPQQSAKKACVSSVANLLGSSEKNAIDLASDDDQEEEDEAYESVEEIDPCEKGEDVLSVPDPSVTFGMGLVTLGIRALSLGGVVIDYAMELTVKLYLNVFKLFHADLDAELMNTAFIEIPTIEQAQVYSADGDAGGGAASLPFIALSLAEGRGQEHTKSFFSKLVQNVKSLRPECIQECKDAGGPCEQDDLLVIFPAFAGGLLIEEDAQSSARQSLPLKLEQKSVPVKYIEDEDAAEAISENYCEFLRARMLREEQKQEMDAKLRRSSRLRARGRGEGDSSRDSDVVLVYPMESGVRDAITIHHCDLLRAEPGEFLNDSLVDFYLKFMLRNGELSSVVKDKRADFHVFSSHFFTKLQEKDHRRGTEMHLSVRRWSRTVDLFSTRFIFVPIVEQLHWSLAVICNLSAIGSQSGSNSLQPCIVFMDSLHMHRVRRIGQYLRTYLEHEWISKRGHMRASFDEASIPLIQPKVPTQSNGCDCGVFVLMYALTFFK